MKSPEGESLGLFYIKKSVRRKIIIKGNGEEVISDAGGKPREDDISDDK